MEERHEKEKMRMRQRCKKETRDKRHIAVTKVKKARQELKVGREKYKEELHSIYTVKFDKQCFRSGGSCCNFWNWGETPIC